MAMYDALTTLDVTLISVQDSLGSDIGDGWTVEAFGLTFSTFSNTVGDAEAGYSTDIQSSVFLSPGDSAHQDSSSSGSATDGAAESYALTELGIEIFNTSSEDLTFNFEFVATVEASVSGSVIDGDAADAFALIQHNFFGGVEDELYSVSVDLPLEPFFEGIEIFDSFSITVAANDFFGDIGSFVDTGGTAEATLPTGVPEPTILGLLSLSLAILGLTRRRMKV
jgi:hypothetical protein